MSARSRAAGFTLLEMLVVLLIAGILISLASLTLTRNPRTDLNEEAQRLAVAPEQHMLTVVHQFPGVTVAKRGRTPAKPRPRLDDDDLDAVAREPRRGAQPGEPGANHHHVVAGQRCNSHWRRAIRA